MSAEENRLIEAGRMAAQKNDWRTVHTTAHELITGSGGESRPPDIEINRCI